MSSVPLPLDADAMRLLAEIGFIGAQGHQPTAARALFEALQVLRPDSNLPYIGRALAAISSGRAQDAVSILRDEGLKQHPGDAELLSFLGLALKEAGQSAEAASVLGAALEQQGESEEPHFKMARKLLALGAIGSPPATALLPWGALTRSAPEVVR